MSTDTDDQSVVSDHQYLTLAAEAAAGAAMKGPVPVDPDVAEHMGAFREEALSPADALDSHFDGLNPTALEEVDHE